MALTKAQVDLIRESFALLKPDVQEASEVFYERLFEIAPEVRSLFRGDIGGQGMKFMTTLGLILDDIDDPEALEPYLKQLAEGHAAYGVKPEHYPPMGRALIQTMRETLGDRFSKDAEAAWEVAYDHIAKEMIRLGK
jgi:hemoglobin-like flavoprotein